MAMFAMHLSYGLIKNPCDFRVFVYISYHNIADFMKPYKVFNSHSYSNITPFYTYNFFCALGSPLVFNMMNFSSGISVLRYVPGT